MRKIEKPTEDAVEVFKNCLSIVQNPQLKNRLLACSHLIQEAADELDSKVSNGLTYTIARETLVNGNVVCKELENVYTLRMSKSRTPGRLLYDKIKLSAPYGICPLCCQREVSTLDHYLPKARYPRLSVVPINLIPACKDCNTSKLSQFPKLPEEETIHPYFDDIENDPWLKATVNPTTPPSVKFFVNPPVHWNDLLTKRVTFHFKVFSLNNLYSIHAGSELRQINHRLTTLFSKSGVMGVKKYLGEGLDTRSHASKNSWQYALYQAILNDDWFCNGGFKLTV